MPVIQRKNPQNVIQITGLQYVRMKKGLSIRALAKKIGRDEKLIRLLEAEGIASHKTLRILSEVLSIPIVEITRIVPVKKWEALILQQKMLSMIYCDSAEKKKHEENLKNQNTLEKNINKVLSSPWNKENLIIDHPEL